MSIAVAVGSLQVDFVKKFNSFKFIGKLMKLGNFLDGVIFLVLTKTRLFLGYFL